MLIKGTTKLKKKTLDLSSIHQQITAGQVFPISDDHFKNSDIQMAISMGLLELPDFKEGKKNNNPDRKVECQNMLDRPLALPSRRDDEGKILFQNEILPNQNFTITQKYLEAPEIQAAIGRGYIKVLTENETDDEETSDDFTEATIKIRDLIRKEKHKEPVTKCQEKIVAKLDTNEEIRALPKEVDNSKKQKEEIVWNPGTKKAVRVKKTTLADTAIRTSAVSELKPPVEGIRGVAPTRYVDTEQPIRVDPNVDDPRVNPATVMNPTGQPVIVKTGVYDPSITESSKPEYPKDKPLSKEEAVLIEKEDDDEEEILFVDKEQEKERRAQHPVLSKKELDQEEEIDFV